MRLPGAAAGGGAAPEEICVALSGSSAGPISCARDGASGRRPSRRRIRDETDTVDFAGLGRDHGVGGRRAGRRRRRRRRVGRRVHPGRAVRRARTTPMVHLGLHAAIDGGPYVALEIEDPGGQTILKLTAQGRLARQGSRRFVRERPSPCSNGWRPRSSSGDSRKACTRSRGRPRAVRSSGKGSGSATRWRRQRRTSRCRRAGRGELRCGEPALDSFGDAGYGQLGSRHDLASRDRQVGRPEGGPVSVLRRAGALKFSVELPSTVTSLLVPPAALAGGGTFKLELDRADGHREQHGRRELLRREVAAGVPEARGGS